MERAIHIVKLLVLVIAGWIGAGVLIGIGAWAAIETVLWLL